jgi:large subunit ribosomal protein L4
MLTVDLYNMEGEVIGKVELPENIFGYEGSDAVIYEAVKAHLKNCRQGTASSKSRGEVRGGGKKPYRQKGTGRARTGSIRNPLWRGGGIIFGPKPKKYQARIPAKVRKAALYTALSDKVKEGNLVVIDKLLLDAPKTAKMVEVFKKLKLEKPLVVLGEKDENVILSVRNIPGTATLRFEYLYAYEVIRHPKILMTKDVIDNLNNR